MLTGLALLLAVSVSPPSPSPLPSPECAHDVEVVKAVSPQLERDLFVHIPHHGISVVVDVTIGPDGKPVEAHTVQSSGLIDLDRAAIDSARFSIWKPKMVPAGNGATCKAVTGTYRYTVTVTPNA